MMNFMNGLNNAIQQSTLTRFLANIVATVTIITAVIVLAIEALHGEALNPWFIGVAGLGLGQYANITGVNQGVTLQPLQQKPIPTPIPVPTKQTVQMEDITSGKTQVLTSVQTGL
jgi:hypothetical protein